MSFMARIELHHAATPAHYNVLHAAAAAEGFSRAVRADDGREYQLPTGTYATDAHGTHAEALNAAQRAAQRTGLTYSIIVVDFTGWSGSGLPVVNQPRPGLGLYQY